MFRKENGFTFLEMLVVMTIVLIVSSLSFVYVRTTYENKIVNQFFEVLQEDIWLAQQHAISHSQSVELTFYTEQAFYDIRESGLRKLINKRPVHPSIRIRPLTMANPIKFQPNGNISGAGTVYVYDYNDTYKLIFQLGRGRFRVEKQ
ncbi:competence type IV pilus minor pilin ComGD [Bacillus suaedaesalsae]|uniref:Type II secretion system protein n=1 Tax=Bacillus suaedaesalsae TaxID=2810349 RepID=A0ABS2DFP2_9BACI|nr:competence type IV pilus minor pilin ComGD [Bacillus suaedaesalsae]MBM6617302.1 type II secretion system protein [Bacillus suaedaesalsae]